MRYFTGFLIAIGLIVLIFVIIFKGGGNKTQQQQIDLNSYANSEAIVQLTIDGPETADQTHQAVRISIGRSESRFELLKGYQGDVVKTKSYQNNQESYSVFLRALNLAGFTRGSSNPKTGDERGYCPNGERYIYELNDASDQIERYWSTSCGQGTYRGSSTQTLLLFQKQIPDYDDLTSDVPF